MKKSKRKRKLAKRRFLARQSKPKAGNILKYIQQYNPREHHHYKFMLVARVSSWKQVSLGYLDSQLYRLKKFAKENDLNVFTDVAIVRSAFWSGDSKEIAIHKFQEDPELYVFNPVEFDKPHYVDFEKYLVPVMLSSKVPAAFLFESACRAIRSDDYSFENKDVKLTDDKLKEFVAVMNNIPVITILNPEATFDEIDSWRKTYGSEFTRDKKPVDRVNRKAGHQDKVIRRFKWNLRFNEKYSHEKIYDEIFERFEHKLPRTSIKYWCQEYKKTSEYTEYFQQLNSLRKADSLRKRK